MMNKISAASWMKMIAIVSFHLFFVGWVLYHYREPVGSCASAGWSYVIEWYGACEEFVVDVWNRVPSVEKLKDSFVRILKLEPFR